MPLVGCTTQHSCGNLKTVESGHVLSPWVKCIFRGGGGNEITVGNESCPSLDNSAVIKSFNFGISDGGECKITIHDQMGSSLHVFLKNMVKQLQDQKDWFIIIQWGWTKSGCPNPPPSSTSKRHYLQMRWLETNFVQGKFIHEITAVDTMSLAVEGGIEEIFGEEGKNGLYLKDALQKLFTEKPHPIVKSVKYCRLNKSTGKPECGIGFKEGGTGENAGKGPKFVWKGNAANKLETARSWIGPWVTDQDKTFVLVYETLVDGGEIIFWERPVFDCDEVTSEAFCLGTYIVNGGADSPVIEFNPRIKWGFAGLPANGGNVPVATVEDVASPQNKAQGVKHCIMQSRTNQKGAGQVISITTPDVSRAVDGDKATGVAMDGQAKQIIQDSIFIMDSGIMADMTIVGDPTLPTQMDGVIQGKTIAIAFVNPFHLLPSSGKCGDWLASPPCNEVLSNKNWLIMKMNHRIEGGTYTTSFTLRCLSPGFDTGLGNPIGGAPDGATI
jgi:hypothetical protein